MAGEAETTRGAGEFAQVLKQTFKPRTEREAAEVESSLKVLVEQALADASLVKTDILDTVEEMIKQLDRKLSAQMNEILHAPQFQQIESAWRGLKYLVFQFETGAMLKIRALNISKDELVQELLHCSEAGLEEAALFRNICEDEFGRPREPHGCLIGDYSFSHTPADVALLRYIGTIAAVAQAPFFAEADSSLIGIESWNELPKVRDLRQPFDAAEYDPWQSLRESEEANYLSLCMPRVLARLPYGEETEPVEAFAYEEDTDGSKGEKYAWMNPAYAMAVNISHAFMEYGWDGAIQSIEAGGEVEGLISHAFRTGDGDALYCPTETVVSERRVSELFAAGLTPLVHRRDTDSAFFPGAQSLAKPES